MTKSQETALLDRIAALERRVAELAPLQSPYAPMPTPQPSGDHWEWVQPVPGPWYHGHITSGYSQTIDCNGAGFGGISTYTAQSYNGDHA